MKYTFGFILIFFWLSAHTQPALDRVQEVGDVQEFEYIEWTGNYNRIIPVKVSVSIKNKTDASGYIEYADNQYRSELLGDLVGDQITLYEYDDYHQVIGKLSGPINNVDANWLRSESDGSNVMSIANASQETNQLVLFTSASRDKELFLRPNHKSFVVGEDYTNLKWSSFDCIGEDCYEEHPKMNTHNAQEFKWEKEGNSIDINSLNYNAAEQIPYAHDSYYDRESYYGFLYPVLGDKVFDSWVFSKVTMAREVFNTYANPKEEKEGNQFVQGDFFITALSSKMISGYLYYSGNMSNNVVTIPFIFDRDKSKFYKINDLLKADFDYAFFLDQYLGKIKRGRMIKEEAQVQSVLKKEHFKHYVLSNKGILFFTDFNTLFGRRSIVVPYTELEGFIDNKSVNNFIKKKA